MSTVKDEVDRFFNEQRQRVAAIMTTAEAFVKGFEFKDDQLGFAQLQLRELDLKLREAQHRVGDLCAVAAQSPRSAAEIVGVPE